VRSTGHAAQCNSNSASRKLDRGTTAGRWVQRSHRDEPAGFLSISLAYLFPLQLSAQPRVRRDARCSYESHVALKGLLKNFTQCLKKYNWVLSYN